MTGLEIDIRVRRGGFALDVQCTLPASGVTVIFGPSGSGKTTLLRAIAGFERAEGRIAFDGTAWSDAATFVPPHRRRIAYVFQDARLFPHLDVAGNLRYAARRAGTIGRIGEVVAQLDLHALLHRRAATLSGGESQRVAIGRALLAAPRLILMDEPVSALDLGRRGEVLTAIEKVRDTAGIPILYVTHALTEAARLGRDCLLLDQGRSIAFGPLTQVLAGSAAADDGGPASIVEARVGPTATDGLVALELPGGTIFSHGAFGPEGSIVRLVIQARDVLVAIDRPNGLSALNILDATVAEVADGPDSTAAVTMETGGQHLMASLTRRSALALGLEPGKPCFAILKSVAVSHR